MSETTTTPGTGWGIIALAAVVALGIGFVSLVKKDEPSRDEKVTIVVAFAPTPREVPIHVIAHVGNAQVAEELVTHSWWSITVDVPPGTQVSVQATQETPGNLECAITVNGKTVPDGVSTRADVGSIRCYHNRAGS